jgi:hypothetical protein
MVPDHADVDRPDHASPGLWSPASGRRALCLIGMHRSGTSLAARMLSLLGVSLGSPEGLLPPGPDNPAGYWENKSIQEFDDELLADRGGAWDHPPVLAPGWERDAALEPHRLRASRCCCRSGARS